MFFFGLLFISVIAGGDGDKITLKDNSVIELDLSNITLDYAGKVNFKDFNYIETNHNGLTDVLNAIDYAKTDENIKGISILNNFVITSYSIHYTKLYETYFYFYKYFLKKKINFFLMF